MIRIKKSKTADTRSAEEPVSKEQLLESSKQHIGDVGKALEFFCGQLRERAQLHDFTKIENIDQFHEDFAVTQKSKKDNFKELPWFNIHINSERHHLNDRCPDDVNLFDVMERVADIVMAGMGRTGKVFDDTLSPEILERAYKNTVTLLKEKVIVED